MADPTKQEKDLWDAIIARIKPKKNKWPTPVNDVLDSLDHEITKTVTCPSGSRIKKVTIKIETKLVSWDVNKINNKSAEAHYSWIFRSHRSGNEKTVTCTNEVMLNPAEFQAREDSGLGLDKLANESLIYHELLHGQKLIDAFTHKDWIETICKCRFAMHPGGVDSKGAPEEEKKKSEQSHNLILDLEEKYLINTATDEGYTFITKDEIQTPEPDGSFQFDIDVAQHLPEDKRRWTWRFVSKENVEKVVGESVDGKLHVTGKLIDKSKEGRFRVIIDPPAIAILTEVTITPSERPKSLKGALPWILLGIAVIALVLLLVSMWSNS